MFDNFLLWSSINESELLQYFQQNTQLKKSPQSKAHENSQNISFIQDNFYENLLSKTNENLSEAKKKGFLEDEVQNVDLPELRKLLGVIFLMQNYNFYSYKAHFEPNPTFFKSPVVHLIGFERFKTLLTYISLSNHKNTISDTMFFLKTACSNHTTYLFLQKKNFKQINLSILLLYDEKGYLLNGISLNENEEIDQNICIFLFNEYQEKNCTIIFDEALTMNILEFLQKNLHINFIVYYKKFELKIIGLSEIFTKENNYFIYWDRKLMISKILKGLKNDENGGYLLMNNLSFYHSNEGYGIDIQATNQIRTIQHIIDKRFQFTIQKNFEITPKPDLDLILFLLENSINNCFLNKNYNYNKKSFSSFIQDLIKELLPPIVQEEKKLVKKFKYHFPEKMKSWCKRCKVCSKDCKKIKKTKYKCRECSIKLGRDLPLCVFPCFKTFHKNKGNYIDYSKKKKIEI